MFRAGVPVRQLPLKRGLCRDQKWRSAQVVDLVYADDVHVRIINSHQPSSNKREFKYNAQLQVMRSLIRLAFAGGNRTRGAVIGTDLNLQMTTIWTGLNTEKTWQVRKNTPSPQCVFGTGKNGVRKHHGDVVIGLNLEMMQVDCCVKNRDPQHESVVAGWVRPVSYTHLTLPTKA